MADNVQHFDATLTTREQWLVGPLDRTVGAMGGEPVTVQGVLDALQNVDTQDVYFAGFADYERYGGDHWAAFAMDKAAAVDILEEYAQAVEAGELTDMYALNEFLQETANEGKVEDTLSIAVADTRSGPPANI